MVEETRAGTLPDPVAVVDVPAVGQLVQVRRRPFVVQDVLASGLLRDVLRPGPVLAEKSI
jgi:hypothetical protein